MDFKDIVRAALDEYMGDLRDALNGLTAEERRYQPNPHSHHIDFVVWHMARVEDDWIQRFAQRTDSVWQREGWFERLGMPERDGGFGYTVEQVAGLPPFEIEQMLGYYDAVRRETLSYIDGLSESDLESTPHAERRPGYTVAKMLAHVIVEESQHVGQAAYLRGMQRGLNSED